MRTRHKISGSSLILAIVSVFVVLILLFGCIVLRIWSSRAKDGSEDRSGELQITAI